MHVTLSHRRLDAMQMSAEHAKVTRGEEGRKVLRLHQFKVRLSILLWLCCFQTLSFATNIITLSFTSQGFLKLMTAKIGQCSLITCYIFNTMTTVVLAQCAQNGKGTYRRVVKLLPLNLDISTRDISPPR